MHTLPIQTYGKKAIHMMRRKNGYFWKGRWLLFQSLSTGLLAVAPCCKYVLGECSVLYCCWFISTRSLVPFQSQACPLWNNGKYTYGISHEQLHIHILEHGYSQCDLSQFLVQSASLRLPPCSAPFADASFLHASGDASSQSQSCHNDKNFIKIFCQKKKNICPNL